MTNFEKAEAYLARYETLPDDEDVELLDADFAVGPSAQEIAMMGGKLSPEGIREVGGEAAAEKLRAEGIARDEVENDILPKLFGRRLLRGEIRMAIDADDKATALSLAGSDLELLRLVATYKRRPGQQYKRSPRDPKPHTVAWFNDLLDDINLLRKLWKQNGIKVEDPKVIARKIIARRYRAVGFDKLENTLANFDKNRSRKPR